MHQLYMGTVGDTKTLEQHFTRMAEQGWMIEKIGLFTHRYRAVEPCKKCFFVDLLPQITAFDYPENEDAQDYRSICEESGWDFIAANKQLHVFCADGENPAPMPIHTDNAIQAKIYLKACRKYELPWLLYALFMFWFSSPIGKGVELFLSNISLFMAIGYCFFLIGFIWTFGFVLRWYMRTRKSAKNDMPLPKVNYNLSKLRNKVFLVGIVVFLVCMITGIVLEIVGGMSLIILPMMLIPISAVGVGFWVRRQIDTKRRTRAANIGFFIIVIVVMELVLLGAMGVVVNGIISSPLHSDSLDNRPVLTLNDVGITDAPSSYNTRIKGTVAVPVDYEHWEINQQGSTRTQVYRSISSTLTRRLYDHCAEGLANDFDAIRSTTQEVIIFTSEEAAFWGAEEGMAQFYTGSNAAELLLMNGKTILRLTIEGEDMSLETVSQAVQKLWGDAFQTQ